MRDSETVAKAGGGVMKKALPEVFRGAAERGVVIGEGADGLQIPAALK
jgi:hypothetical protein